MSRHRRARDEVLRALNEIRRLRSEEGMSDIQIMKELKIVNSTFYNTYMRKIYQQDRDHLERIAGQQIEHEVLTLKERFEGSIRNLTNISKDAECEARDRIEAERLKMEASLNVLKLLVQGPEAIGYGRNSRDKQAAIRIERAVQ